MRLARTAAIATLMASAAPAALAQSDDPVDDMLACRTIQDVEARLACFDATAAVVASARDSGDLVTVTRDELDAVEREGFGWDLPSLPALRLPSLRGASQGSDNAFAELEEAPAPSGDAAPAPTQPAPAGSTGSTSPAPARVAEAEPAPADIVITERNDDGGVERIEMTLSHTRTVGYNTTVFHMENGQVWRQVDSYRVRLPRDVEGMMVEIRRAAMTSYLLRLEGEGRAIRVRRER